MPGHESLVNAQKGLRDATKPSCSYSKDYSNESVFAFWKAHPEGSVPFTFCQWVFSRDSSLTQYCNINVVPPQFMCNKSSLSTGSFCSLMSVKWGVDVPGNQCHSHSFLIFVTAERDALTSAVCHPGVEGTSNVWVIFSRLFPHIGISSAAPK